MMQRTNIYLSEEQLGALRSVGALRGVPVAALVREAVAEWLGRNGVRPIPDDEWARRLGELLERRRRVAEEHGFSEAEVERDVMEAVREVRRERTARRR